MSSSNIPSVPDEVTPTQRLLYTQARRRILVLEESLSDAAADKAAALEWAVEFTRLFVS